MKSGEIENAVRRLRGALSTLGGVYIFHNIVGSLAEFSQSMSTVQAVSGATSQDMKALTAEVMRLGMTTRFTATETASGLVDLARAGLTTQEQMTALSNTLRLAQAGNLDVANASRIMITALRGQRLSAQEAAHVTDVLAKAANTAVTDVFQMGEALRYVGPVARGMKMPFEETAAAIGILSNSALPASMAGTGLRRVIAELEAPTTKTVKILRQYGVRQEEVRITSVGLIGALKRLRVAGIDAGRSLQIFGQRGGPAFEVMVSSLPALETMNKSLGDSADYCENVAEIMDNNLNGALLKLKASLQATVLTFGQLSGNNALTVMFNVLADTCRYLSTHLEVLDTIINTLAIMTLPRAVMMFQRLITMTMPIAAIFALAVGALIAYRDQIKMSAESSTSLGDFGEAAFERIKQGGQAALDFFKTRFSGVSSVFEGVNFDVAGMVTLTARGLDRFVGFFRAAINAIEELFKNLGPALKELLTDVMNEVLSTLDIGFKKFYEMLGKIPGRVGAPYRRLAQEGVLPELAQTAEGATERLSQAVTAGWKKGFDQIMVFEDSANDMLARADQISKERIARQQAEQAADRLGNVPAGPGMVAPGAAPSPGGQPVDQLAVGIESGMQKISNTVNLYGTQVEATLVNAFGNAEDAVVNFVQTGKFSFKGMVDGMLADLTRLMFRMAMMKLLNPYLPSAEGTNFGGGRAEGGDVTPGNYYLVGERGREWFVPQTKGTIVPEKTARSVPQIGNVTIINVSTKDEALAAMRTSEGQRVIINTGQQAMRKF